jgi:hypothetical protein
MKSRRRFLSSFVAQGGILLGLAAGLEGQGGSSKATRPFDQKDKEEDENSPKIDPKRVLEENQKNIKKNIDKLYKLAGELKAEVDKTDAMQVLSMAMLKKTEEIEKLAKEIRSRAIG